MNIDKKKLKKQLKPKEAKELKLYKQEQLILPLVFPEHRGEYSSTIELYDAIPKYNYQKKVKRIEGYFLHPIERKFVFRNREYETAIFPAKIEVKKGVYKDFFPGLREELVEDALRKLACEGKGGTLLDDKVGIVFTLYELRKELKEMGHDYSIVQIKQALMICSQTNIFLEAEDGSEVLTGSIFETVGLQTKEDWKGTGSKTKCFVRFNILVDKSIKEKTFRPLDYKTCMAYNKNIARWLHKRINHVYTQANWNKPYHIMLSTIIRDSGMTKYKELRNNLREVLKALDEMKERGVLSDYDPSERLLDGRKLVDVKFVLKPGQKFIREMKEINAKIRDMKLI